VCTALQVGGDVEQPWLMSKYDVILKTARVGARETVTPCISTVAFTRTLSLRVVVSPPEATAQCMCERPLRIITGHVVSMCFTAL